MSAVKKGIPWSLNISAEVKTEYMGAKLGEYYTDPYVMMNVQLDSSRIFNELYGIPVSKYVTAAGDLCYPTASILGAEVIFPEDDPPEIRGRRIKSIEDMKSLRSGDPWKSGVIPIFLEHYEYMKRKAEGTDIQVDSGFGPQGPFTTAVILRGMDFFVDIVLNPDESKVLLETCTEANIMVMEMMETLSGKKAESIWMGDDYGGMMSPEMYAEFVYPYLKKIFYCNSFNSRTLHCETLKKGHLKFLDMLGINSYDPGVDDDLSVMDIIENTDVRFSYNLFTVRDMLNGNPDTIRRKYIEIVRDGAPEVTAEICRGTPKENVLAYVNIAREFE